MRDKRLGVSVLIGLSMLTGCTSGVAPTSYQTAETSMATPMSEAPEAETYTVSMDNHRFMPQSITIPAGSTVTWVNNEEGVPHTTTSDTGLWDSGNMTTGQSYSYRFDEPGTYPYNCTLHRDQGMVGTVIVK